VSDQIRQRAGAVAEEQFASASSLHSTPRRAIAPADNYSGARKAGLIALCCLAALAAALWWRSRQRPVAEVPSPRPVQVAETPPPTPPLEGQPIASLVATTLPSGRQLQLEPGSTTMRIVEFLKIRPSDRPAERFILREIEFNPDETAAAKRSADTIGNLAQVLAAFPHARLRIRSYDQGENVAARPSGMSRSERIKSMLVERGVPEERLVAEQAPAQPGGNQVWTELIVEAPNR
jgi:hypothetical protein